MVAAAVAAGAALALAVFLALAGATPAPALPGLPDAGRLVGWLVPLSRLTSDLAAVGAVGCLLYVAVLRAGREEGPGETVEPALRSAVWCAWTWAAAAGAGSVFALADISGLPLGELLTAQSFPWWLVSVEQSRLLLLVAAVAGLVAYVARGVRTVEGPLLALVLAMVALLPPLLTGHTAAEGDHALSIVSLMVHVVAVTGWVGGLVALLLFGRTPADIVAVTRFSAVAFGCFLATGISGLVNAWVRLAAGDGVVAELFGSRYGWLVLGKMAALGTLAGFGYWHRRRTIGQLAAGRPGAFGRFAGCEVLVMVATIALAVALSRTPTPVPEVVDTLGAALLR